MAEDTFKLPGSSYEEICKIIQAYGKLPRPSSLEDVAQTVKMHPTVISRNNAFLSSVGIIDGGKLKSANDIGKDLARALEYDHSDQVSAAWREIVKRSEFLTKMLTAIKIRKSMDVTTFQSHIAYSAGQPKSTNTMAGAKAIIDILKNAELIVEKDGQLIPSNISLENVETVQPDLEQVSKPTIREEQSKIQINQVQVPTSSGNIAVSLNINIDVKPEELDGLGEKIRNLLNELTEISATNETNNH